MTETARTGRTDRRSVTRGVAERVLVLAPTGDDAAIIQEILREHGRTVTIVEDVRALIQEIGTSAGTAVIAAEALEDGPWCAKLREVLEHQEPWSDLPVLVLGTSGDSEAAEITELLGASAQVLLLERPLGVAPFLTAVDAALRSRRRQYEVRRLLAELAASAEEIARVHEDANRAKNEFIATLAHELRSPITAITGWIQALKLGDLNPDEAADALSMIESSAKVQAHIIEDLMDVSRILAGKVMIVPAAMELQSVVARAVATFRPAAALQGIHLTSLFSPEPLIVWADEVRIQQIGWNLISNAIKFTPRGGSVHVTVGREDDSAVIRVRDTGRGIAPELLAHVFERYRQDDIIANGKQHGLGLGLSIVRHLVERHGGTIQAFSEGLDRGAEFVVTLPLYVS